MNEYTISGLFVGAIFGFLLGRAWAEYFRAVWVGQEAQRTRRFYRGTTFAWYIGAFLIVGGALLYGYVVPA